ncbi:MAG: type II toxin-antitoxin system RelE family toxin, partial [Candidatus Dormibacteraceae bacterium]
NTIELSRRAGKDIERLSRTDRRRVREAFDALASGVGNLDIKMLVGCNPWLRLRVGELRILYRSIPDGRLLIGRVVNRRDLERAVRSLGVA